MNEEESTGWLVLAHLAVCFSVIVLMVVAAFALPVAHWPIVACLGVIAILSQVHLIFREQESTRRLIITHKWPEE